MTREVTVRQPFNWIILTAPGAPCGCYEIHREEVVWPFDVMFGNRFGHFLQYTIFLNQFKHNRGFPNELIN